MVLHSERPAQASPGHQGYPARTTLASLEDDHRKFSIAGGDVRKTKMFNNVIGQTFFPIPLERVTLGNNKWLVYKSLYMNMCAFRAFTSPLASLTGSRTAERCLQAAGLEDAKCREQSWKSHLSALQRRSAAAVCPA